MFLSACTDYEQKYRNGAYAIFVHIFNHGLAWHDNVSLAICRYPEADDNSRARMECALFK